MTEPHTRRNWLRALAVVGALAAALASVVAWLASSEAALAWAVERVVAASGGRLEAAGVRGTLLGAITAERIAYADPTIRVEARDVRLQWSPAHLLRQRLAIDRLEARHVAVRLVASDAPAALPDDLAPPIAVRVRQAQVDAVDAESGATRVALRGVRLGYEGDARAHRLRALEMDLEVGAERANARADAEIGARRPFPVAATIALAQAPARTARLKLGGTLARTEIDATAAFNGVPLAATAVLRPFEPRWLEALDTQAQDVDLARVADQAPRTAISLHITARSETETVLAGNLAATNALAGPLDRGLAPVGELTTEFSTDLRTVRIAQLRIALPGGGRMEGSGDVAADAARLVLDAQALSLRAIHSTLIETALAGRLEATLAPGQQALRASLAQAPITISADVQRVGDEVRFREVRAAAKRGELRASGTLRLDGAMPLAMQARFARFDPSEWGDYPQATLNGELGAQAELARRAGTVRFTIADSRLRGVPLSGRGTIEGTEHDGTRRVAAAQAELVVGANRASVRGAFGAPGDELQVTLAAPRVAELDPRLQGRVDALARVVGTWDAPRLAFSASAVDLRYGNRIALGSLGAAGELGWAPGSPLRIDVTTANVAVGGLDAERVEIHTTGTQDQHAIDVQAAGARRHLDARLVGGWRPGHGWSGSLTQLEHRGAERISLEQATTLEIGSELVHVGAFTVRFADGRIVAQETHWAPGKLTSSGEFTNLPVSPILALAGAGEAVSASLTVNGNWRLAATPRWSGRVQITRAAGDLVFLTEPALPLGLTVLRLDGDLVDERATGTLVAQGTGIELRAEAEAVPVGSGPEAGLGRDSPLALKARLDVPSLKPFAALFGIPANIGGRMRADVAAAGTLGTPMWRGTVEAHELRVQSPPYGIDWTDGRLLAELMENTVRVTELTVTAGAGRLTAQGVLERAGDERTGRVTWRADRFAALNRPDRSLILSGSGIVAADARRLTLQGQLRADAGRFEFDPRTGAVLGDDVVVLGRPDARSTRRTGERRVPVVLDLDLDLGDDLTVRGAGLDARLAGRLRVQSLTTGQVVTAGTVETRRGTFYAFGQRLEIERGRLLFDGPIDNPGLDIAAWRRNQAVEAGVEVKGPLRTPLVRVVTNPPVPESEQLAWLVLGRPAESGAQADYAALQVAAAALLRSTSGTQQPSVAQMVGLDEIGFRSAGATGGQAVALGKRLGDRFYATYEQSIDVALAVFRLEFALTHRIALRAETGSRSGMDVFYRYSFD